MAKDDREYEELEDDAPRLRPFWSGTISFGLVSVPVDLYPAVRSKRVSLRMLSPDGTPLSRRYYDPENESEIGRDDIVRGYELDDGEIVTVTDEELEALEPEKTRDIDLRRFVPAQDIDPRYFERGYFLTPAEGSNKAYRLLAAVMEKTKRAGIATFVMRGKEYLVAIFAEDGIMRAETMRFADELRAPEDVGLPDVAKPKPATVKKMTTAINKRKKSDISEKELQDEWAAELLKLVARKAKKGEDTVDLPEEDARDAPDSDVIDLMAVLKRSLEGANAGGSARKGTKRAGEDLASLSKDELYEKAQELDIPGRSGMTKKQLVKALESA